MTLEQITHDLASIDRVVYRTDMLRNGIHAWMLGRGGPKQRTMLVSFRADEPLPTDEGWAAKLAEIKAEWQPGIVMAI
jgi:hypothetical protein